MSHRERISTEVLDIDLSCKAEFLITFKVACLSNSSTGLACFNLTGIPAEQLATVHGIARKRTP